jgi:thiol-disulfide isomerase/thioredoxin
MTAPTAERPWVSILGMAPLSRLIFSTGFLLLLLTACAKQSPEAIREYLNDREAAVFAFLAPDCPLSQKYTRTLNNLRIRFAANNVEFYAVFVGDTEVDEFVKTYELTLAVINDREYRLVDFFEATKTPEVFVVVAGGEIVYKGAIDNWAPELGQRRTVITEHYLLDALTGIVEHKKIPRAQTEAAGCFIEKR